MLDPIKYNTKQPIDENNNPQTIQNPKHPGKIR